jgi:hypothetical protein
MHFSTLGTPRAGPNSTGCPTSGAPFSQPGFGVVILRLSKLYRQAAELRHHARGVFL